MIILDLGYIRVTLCVVVLRGNRTAAESAVIANPLAPKLKVFSSLKSSGVLKRCATFVRTQFLQLVGICAALLLQTFNDLLKMFFFTATKTAPVL